MNNQTTTTSSLSNNNTTTNPLNQISQSVQKAYTNTVEGSKQFINNTAETVNNVGESLRENVQSLTQPSTETAKQFNTEFLTSNSIIAKFAFVVLVIIVFLILVKLGIVFLGNTLQQPSNPYIIKGMIASTNNFTIPRDPKQNNSVELLRSNNQKTGMEFTWSVWLNVISPSTTHTYSHVFNVGNKKADPTTGLMTINNAPGMYLTAYKKGYLAMHVMMDIEPQNDATETAAKIYSKSTDITELPYNQWFHVALRMENTVMDVYINGKIAGRIPFETVPKQNYYDVNVCSNGGFQGNLSDLRYYSKALNVFEINKILNAGPTLSAPVIAGSNNIIPSLNVGNTTWDYISSMWYSRGTPTIQT